MNYPLSTDLKSIKILNSRVDLINVKQLHERISGFISEGKKVTIGNLNINAANVAYTNNFFASYIEECPIIFCDGKGIQLAAFLLGKKVPSHITYHTWIWELVNFCEEKNYSLFFLGSTDDVVKSAIKKVKQICPKITVSGYHGFFDKTNHENDEVIEMINKFNPHIVIVGFGMPKQERWISSNKGKINANIFLNGGAYLEWISGKKNQSPKILTKLGLEWFYRFLLEPRRLFKRYIIGNPLFIFRIIKQKISS